MKRLLVFDNYDSFTYNLVHLIEKVGNVAYEVHRNDQISLETIAKFDKILLSPGPGIPSEAGSLLEVIRTYASSKSILGVCLGLQAIGEAFGGKLENLDRVYHGVATPVQVLKSDLLFKDCPQKFSVGRYHSWVVSSKCLPENLEVTAVDEQGYIMAMKHMHFDIHGVQFHPESILSEYGDTILRNWLQS